MSEGNRIVLGTLELFIWRKPALKTNLVVNRWSKFIELPRHCWCLHIIPVSFLRLPDSEAPGPGHNIEHSLLEIKHRNSFQSRKFKTAKQSNNPGFKNISEISKARKLQTRCSEFNHNNMTIQQCHCKTMQEKTIFENKIVPVGFSKSHLIDFFNKFQKDLTNYL